MHGSGDKCLRYPLFWSGFLFDCPGKLLLKHWQLMEVQRTSNLIFCLRNKNQKPFKNVINLTSSLNLSVMLCMSLQSKHWRRQQSDTPCKSPKSPYFSDTNLCSFTVKFRGLQTQVHVSHHHPSSLPGTCFINLMRSLFKIQLKKYHTEEWESYW